MIISSLDEMTTELVPGSQRGQFTCSVCGIKNFSVKYKLTNRTTKEVRYFCNICHVKVANTIERANKLLEDDFYQIPTFIRFGEMPEDKVSTIFFRGNPVGKEKGLSVYHGVKIDGRWHVVYPNPSNEGTNCDIQDFLGGPGPGAPDSEKKVYLLTGQLVGYGSDGEPLITRVRILEDLTGKFVFEKGDKGYDAAVASGVIEETE